MKTGSGKYGDFVVREGRMLFNRVGGINANVQTNKRAPVGRGMWAFPYPLFERFYVGAPYSTPHRHAPKEGKEITLSKSDIIVLKKRLKGLKARYEKALAQKDQPTSFAWQISEYKFELEDIEEGLKTGKMEGWQYRESLKKNKYKNSEDIKQFWYGPGPVYAHFTPDGFSIEPGCWHMFPTVAEYVSELRKQIISWADYGYPTETKIGVYGLGYTGMGCDDLEVFLPMIKDTCTPKQKMES